MLSIRLLGKSTLHVAHTPQSGKHFKSEPCSPLFKITTQPNIKLTEFPFLIIFTTVLICFFKVVVRTVLDYSWLKSWVLLYFWYFLYFLSLVPRGRACISIHSPEVSLKDFVFVWLFTDFMLSCHRKIQRLSGYSVTNWTSRNTDIQSALHILPSSFNSFQFLKKVL